MCTIIQVLSKRILQQLPSSQTNFYKCLSARTFLSNAYYCNEVWNSRLKSPILEKVNLDDLYHELDLRYQKNKNISAVDVDVFANALQDDTHTDELLDLVHKLRLSADTGNMLESTSHSVIRYLMNYKHYDKLLQVLNDRLNYGVFMDSFTVNILLDTFWKNKDYVSGAKIASQLMLQEDFSHSLNLYLALIHCYKYLSLKCEGWEKDPEPEEPKEEVKVRVKYIRNPYFDDHFDLKEPHHLVGKTLWMAGCVNDDSLSRTFQLVGLELYEKHEKSKELVKEFAANKVTIIKQGLDLLPEDNEIRLLAEKLTLEDVDIEQVLIQKVQEAERKNREKDISVQCQMYKEWEKKRFDALEKQRIRYNTVQRIENIKVSEDRLKEKEMKLWFFDREEQLELDIESKRVFYPKRWFGKKKKPKKADEGYVPPEVKAAYSKQK